MLKRILSILFAVSLCLSAAPTFAAEKVGAPPKITPVTSLKLDFVLTVTAKDGLSVVLFGKGEATADREHVVSVDNTTGDVTEEVTIGDTIYERHNMDKRWKASAVSDANQPVNGPAAPASPGAEPVIYLVGDTNVNDAPTTQYQIPVAANDLPKDLNVTSGVVDVFIGKNDGFVRKVQQTYRGTDKEIGDFVIEFVQVFSAFNQPLVIGAPSKDLVDQGPSSAAAAQRNLAGVKVLPLWARLLVAQSTRQLRQSR